MTVSLLAFCKKMTKVIDFLLSREPPDHLRKFILLVCCSSSMLSKINVKTFKHFCIVVVSCPKELNILDIMDKRMEFGKIEVFSIANSNEIILVLVKILESIFQIAKSDCVISCVLSKIDKVKKSLDSLDTTG